VLIVSPTLRRLLSLDTGAFGWLLASWMALGIAGSLLGGWLSDQGHLRAAAYGACALLVASYGLCALPPTMGHSYSRYIAGLALTGLANATLSTVGNVALTRAFPLGARRALTWLQVSVSAAGMVAPPVWGWLLVRLTDSRLGAGGAVQALFCVAAAACLGAFFVLYRRPLPETARSAVERTSARHESERSRSIFGLPLLAVVAFTTLHSAADNGAFLWVPDFVEGRFAPTPFPVAWILSGISAAYVVGRLVLVNLPDRWRDLTVLTTSSGLGAVFLFFAFRSASEHNLAALYITGALFLSADYPSVMAHIGQLFPKSTGRVMAIAGGVAQAGSVLVPPLMGYLGQAAGTMVAGMTVPPLMFGTLSLCAFAWRKRLDRYRYDSTRS